MIDPRTYRWRVAPLPPATMVEDPHLSSLRPAVTDIDDDDGTVTMTGGTEEDAYYRLLAVLAEDTTTCYHTLEREDD